MAVPQPSFFGREMVSGVEEGEVGGEWRAHLDDVVDAAEVVEVFARATVEQQLGEVDGALPGLEAAFVDVGADVGFVQAGQRVRVGAVVFGHQLDADIKELAAR